MCTLISPVTKQVVFSRFARHSLARLLASRTVTQSISQDSEENVKPFSDIPGPRGLPVIGTVLEWRDKVTIAHEVVTDRHVKFGPIYKEKSGTMTTVFVTDLQAIEQLYRQEGKYPVRTEIPIWEGYRHDRGQPLGIFLSNGEEWHRMRRSVNQPLLKARSLDIYAEDLNTVAGEMVQKLARSRKEDQVAQNIEDQLFNWALESVSCVLYGRRLGCLDENPAPEIKAFIEANHNFIGLTGQYFVYPVWFMKIFLRKKWNELCSCFDTIFDMAYRCIDDKMEEIEKETAGQKEDGGFIKSMLSQGTLSQKELYANVTELMSAAVDTTSNTVLWTLHELSQNPDIQQKVLEEANAVVPPGELPTPDHLRNMPYLRAVIKETLRIHPTVVMVARKVPIDVVILGYKIPANTRVCLSMYTLGRLPSLWKNPNDFRPERWERNQVEDKINPFASLPFGFGPRMCIGRRLAEMEMQLLLHQIVRKFRLTPANTDPVEAKMTLMMTPKDPLRLKLEER